VTPTTWRFFGLKKIMDTLMKCDIHTPNPRANSIKLEIEIPTTYIGSRGSPKRTFYNQMDEMSSIRIYLSLFSNPNPGANSIKLGLLTIARNLNE
jgi:hypothetical protein